MALFPGRVTSMAEQDNESDPLESLPGISFPERKGRKMSPQRKKRLDYEHQAHYWGGEGHRKRRKAMARSRSSTFRPRVEQLTRAALGDEELAETLADTVAALRKKVPGGNYRIGQKSPDLTRRPLREAIASKKANRLRWHSRSRLQRALNRALGRIMGTPKRKLKKYGPKEEP